MSQSRRPPRPPARAPTEPGLFDHTVSILDEMVNAVFALTYQAGLIRFQIFTIAIFLTWSFIAFTSHPVAQWQRAAFAVINPAAFPEITNPAFEFISQLFLAYFALDVLGHVIAIGLPCYLALEFAAIFLDDIFELHDTNIARNFITQAAFAVPFFRVIHFDQGDIRKTDKKSPVFKIGGPGRVRVSLDTVTVFEKIDGTPNVIGPTDGQRFFTRTLDGFERLRQSIDTRDQTTQIDLEARTRDGMIVQVQNVRLLFSVLRESGQSSLNQPYPFVESAVLHLVYDQSKGPWTVAMTTLVRGELIGFISDRTLGEIFAAVGEPENIRQMRKQREIKNSIYLYRNRSRRYRVLNQLRARQAVVPAARPPARRYPLRMHPKTMVMHPTPSYRSPFRSRPAAAAPGPRSSFSPRGKRVYAPHRPKSWTAPVPLPFRQAGRAGAKFAKDIRHPLFFRKEDLSAPAVPNFVNRLSLSRRFYQEIERSFQARARERGVRLEWIDVGTWQPKSEVIPNQHKEAWLITADNMARSDKRILEELRLIGQTNETIRLLRRPVYRFIELNKQRLDRDEIVYQVIEEYLGILRAARDEYLREGKPLPDRLIPAIEHIQRYQRTYMSASRARYI